LCDLGVGVGNLEIGKIGAIFIQFLWKNEQNCEEKRKKFCFVLGNTCVVLIDCVLL